MSNTVKASDRRWSAFFHIGSMLLFYFGFSPLNILVPLGLMLFKAGGPKGSFLDNQIREVLHFQLVTTLVLYAGIILLLIVGMYVPVVVGGGLLVLLVFTLLMYLLPIWGGIKALLGHPYAYPMVNSPRRKAYVNRKTHGGTDAPGEGSDNGNV